MSFSTFSTPPADAAVVNIEEADREDNTARISDSPGIPAAAAALRPGGNAVVGIPAAKRAAAAAAADGGEFEGLDEEDAMPPGLLVGLVSMEDCAVLWLVAPRDRGGGPAGGGGWEADLIKASRNFISSVFLFMPAQ